MKKSQSILLIFLLILSLFCTRFLDFVLIWNLGKCELKKNIDNFIKYPKKIENIFFSFSGFSNKDKAKENLEKYIKNRRENIIILSYFDFIHPNVYFIYNKGENKTIPLPWLTFLTIEPGFTEIYFYKFDYVTIKSKDKIKKEFIPIVGSIFSIFIKDIKSKKYDLTLEISEYYLSFSYYLKKIYIFYFYFPLFIIILISLFFNRSIYISLFYYFEMLILFLPKLFFECAFLCLLDSLFKFDAIPKIVLLISFFAVIIIMVLFIIGINLGFKVKREKGLKTIEKYIILYFILLPLFLRF